MDPRDAALATVLFSAPGSGGVDRGRADAELTWGQENAEREQAFAARALPRGGFADAEHQQKIGAVISAPTVAPHGEAAGLVPTAASAGDAAGKRRLAPRHRGAVQRFFSPTPTPGEKP